jgi:hypothetical protein
MSPTLPAHARTSRHRVVDLVLVAASLAVLVLVGATAVSAEDSNAYVPPRNAPAGPAAADFTRTAPSGAHEVWLVDQSDTASGHGGQLEIHDGAALRRGAPSAPELVDLAGATTQLCEQSTGAKPTRPHMLNFSPDSSHAVLAFVASGHTVFFDAASRTPVACFRSEQGPNGRQAHASIVTPDGRYVLVANQNGKRLERIRTDYATGTFTAEPAATLDLAVGQTPNGLARQTPDDRSVRPDNAPICPFVPSTGFPAYVSLRGGGAFAVDPYSTPMGIVAEYPAADVPRDGCGFTESGSWVYANGGLPAPAVGQSSGWAVHRFPLGGPETYSASNPPSTPAVQPVQRDARTGRDAHGMTTVGGDVWAFDRLGHALQVFRGATGEPAAEIDLRGPWGGTPAPDIAAASPDQRAVYVATRGPSPLSGAHAARGDAPGLLVLEAGDGTQAPGGAPARRRPPGATPPTRTAWPCAPPASPAPRRPPPRAAPPTTPAPPGKVPGLRFSDVPRGDAHAGAVACLDWWGVARGFDDGTFRPAGPVSRGQMASFVARTVLEGGGTLDGSPPQRLRRRRQQPARPRHRPAGSRRRRARHRGRRLLARRPRHPLADGQLPGPRLRARHRRRAAARRPVLPRRPGR